MIENLKAIGGKIRRKPAYWMRLMRARPEYHWLAGKSVELRGNVVKLGDLEFSVDSPAVSTPMKRHFLQGDYELPERTAIKNHLKADLPIVEFGGSVGVVSCHANKMLRDPRQHVVIEANPDLVPLLEKNRERNGCAFTVLNRALGYGGETIRFQLNQDFWASNTSVDTGRSVEIPTISFGEVIEQFGFERCTVVCDVEGAEVDLVKHEGTLLQAYVDTLIVEVHPWCIAQPVIDDMLQRLSDLGFVVLDRTADNFVMQNTTLH